MTEGRRLRVAYIAIQPVLVWDDGEEMTPGPEIAVRQITLKQAVEMAEHLPAELLALEESLAEPDSELT